MKYIESDSPKLASEAIVKVIKSALAENKSVLWLVSGGSSLDVAAAAARQLENQPKLVVMQVDERFGPPGHKDSNWQQFIDRSFNPDKFSTHSILNGTDIDQTTRSYSNLLKKALSQASFRIGLFGIGADGHTAGILPRSVAANEQNEPVVHYSTPSFNRITITPPTIGNLDLAIVYAVGREKKVALQQLRTELSVLVQPAQSLKQAKELYVYTDYQGEK